MNNVGGYSLAHVGDRVREEGEHLVLLPVDTLAVGVDPPADKTNDHTDHTAANLREVSQCTEKAPTIN